jgi:hypothetical protein
MLVPYRSIQKRDDDFSTVHFEKPRRLTAQPETLIFLAVQNGAIARLDPSPNGFGER